MGEWQPIGSAPKDGTRVLLHYASRVTKIGHWDAESAHWAAGQWMHEKPPTHWQPLPEPPVQSDG